MDNIMKPVFGMVRFAGEFSQKMKPAKLDKDVPKTFTKNRTSFS